MADREIRLAQQAIFKAGKSISEAGLRLRGTRYEKDYDKVFDALSALNTKLIKEIRS